MGTNVSSVEATRSVLDALRHVVQVLRISARAAEMHHGISGAQLFVLHQLSDGVARSINDLAEGTFTHQSSVSVVVSRLASRRLVRRKRGGGDGRRTEVELTPVGRRMLQRAPEPAQARLIEAILALKPAQRSALLEGLSYLLRLIVGLRFV